MEREVTIGVDFGTSTSKVGFREAASRNAFVLPSKPSGSVLWPSVVGVDAQRRLYFGEGLPPSVRPLRWLKMGLSAHGNSWPSALAVTDLGGNCPVDALCAFYVAFAIGQAAAAARYRWSRDDVYLTCNLGAPLDKSSDPKVCLRFEDVARAALALSESAHQGWPLDVALDAWNREIAKPKPLDQYRKAFVVPETHAAVTGALLDRSLPEGHIAAIDIGAGTTDVSVFLFRRGYSDSMYGDKTSYFLDATAPIASYHVDFALAELFWRSVPGLDRPRCSREELQYRVRVAKEQASDVISEIPDWPAIPKERAMRAVIRVCRELGSHFMLTWARAFLEKNKNANAWPTLCILPLGGGSLFRPFLKQFSQHPLAAGGKPAIICPKMQVRVERIDYSDQLMVLNGRDPRPVGLSRE